LKFGTNRKPRSTNIIEKLLCYHDVIEVTKWTWLEKASARLVSTGASMPSCVTGTSSFLFLENGKHHLSPFYQQSCLFYEPQRLFRASLDAQLLPHFDYLSRADLSAPHQLDLHKDTVTARETPKARILKNNAARTQRSMTPNTQGPPRQRRDKAAVPDQQKALLANHQKNRQHSLEDRDQKMQRRLDSAQQVAL
jgi:hypothetical protein